ncbi:MAG: ATP-binding cassette domain-containing protein [Lachnospiraceae bacterium]|nr:ATP-binding cassette domain-containing protein [Lachnospiraceae bacterium]
MLDIKGLSKSFGRKEILHNISCHLDSGVYGLLGPNGAGKTTLLRCVLGLYPYNSGSVLLNEKDTLKEKRESRIGYLPQKSGVFPGLTVEEHLKYFACQKEINKKEADACIDEVLEMVHLKEYRKIKGRKLSGGMVRRLGIAQALLGKPELIIFDEPTTGLDPEERSRFKNIVRQLGKEMTVIMSTHIVEDVEAVCNQIIIIKDGEISAQGSQEEISRYAAGKVYEIPREELTDEDYVEKEKEVDGKEVLRVLSGRAIDADKRTKPNVEDGYLCILKGL